MDDLLMSEEEVTSPKPTSGHSRLQKDMILKKFMGVKKPKNAGNKTVMVIPQTSVNFFHTRLMQGGDKGHSRGSTSTS